MTNRQYVRFQSSRTLVPIYRRCGHAVSARSQRVVKEQKKLLLPKDKFVAIARNAEGDGIGLSVRFNALLGLEEGGLQVIGAPWLGCHLHKLTMP